MKAKNIYKLSTMKQVWVSAVGIILSVNVMASSHITDRLEACKAYCSNYTAVIEWQSANDTNGAFYTIERTHDGVNFSPVANVEVEKGSGLHQYSIVDKAPFNGISYYRISFTDGNCKQTYLNTVVYSSCENDEQLDASDSGATMYIQINANTVDTCSIILKDVNGKVISHQNKKVSLGLNIIKVTPKVSNGVYVLTVRYHKLKLNKVFILNPAVCKL